MKETLLKRVSLLGARSRDLAYSAKEKFKELINDESGMGTVEVILIIVGICIADKSRILCGNFRCI